MTKNEYKCNGGFWKKFSDEQKNAYNLVRSWGQEFISPKQFVSDKEWDVISHNYAVMVALDLFPKKKK